MHRDFDLTDLGQARSLSGELTRDAAVVMLSGLKKQRGDNLENFAHVAHDRVGAIVVSIDRRISMRASRD